MTKVMGIVVLMISAAVVSGCLSEGPVDPCDIGTLELAIADGPSGYTAVDPNTAWETVLLLGSEAETVAGKFELNVTGMGWLAGTQRISQPNEPDFRILHIGPGQTAGRVSLDYAGTATSGACDAFAAGSKTWEFATPTIGDSATAGQGAHVMTAGFYENGTLFYTNIAEIDGNPAWPRPDWYAWGGSDPLPVYVYNHDRAEKPAYWSATTAGTPAGAPTQNATLWNYFTTIPGFNEALKGLSTNTVRVARLTPEEAYTRPGSEAHPLYGAALVFYIKVLDVVDLPCPDGVPASACRVPSIPSL